MAKPWARLVPARPRQESATTLAVGNVIPGLANGRGSGGPGFVRVTLLPFPKKILLDLLPGVDPIARIGLHLQGILVVRLVVFPAPPGATPLHLPSLPNFCHDVARP